ncbi:glycosyltransferase [Marinobacter confluentis]|uniref:Glycosyltransferase n=1 Tax=Marinobacter confluentis TaxID=1697557 RepID=A0A4Z1BFI2_9GAMM|nr:glycosyltransferase [Marinobacter confluentis]TGN41494.1 glycosyltransferase [Marinobacter confluentis]
MAVKGDQPVLFLVPGDPQQRTGGYRYVAQLVKALNAGGQPARVQGLEGQFPIADSVAESAMDSALSACEDGATVVLDGLAMGGLPAVVGKHAARLRLIALVHHPLADETGLGEQDRAFLHESETRALAAVNHVLTTSRHTAQRLEHFQVPAGAIRVIEPGADTVATSRRTVRTVPQSGELQILCVASLSPRKAQHQLVEALAGLQHLSWHCTFVGSTERDPDYSQQLVSQIQDLGLSRRISMVGELGDAALADHYHAADLFVLPSLYEGYGMVIDEALSAGLPIITSDGGALAATGDRPGIAQYPAGSVKELSDCLDSCLTDRQWLQGMTSAAQHSGESVRRWSDAAADFIGAMAAMEDTANLNDTRDHSQFDQQWLVLREPADHKARNTTLLERLIGWLQKSGGNDQNPAEEPLQIADLGAGAGSNGVYLSERLSQPQHWTLLDQDSGLLAKASARLRPKVAGVEVLECTLEAGNLCQLVPHQADLITASALIDLTSANWLDALADAAKARRAGVFIVLSYAGEFQLSPEHPDDDLLRSLVNDHQHGDKGSGAAMGPEATGYLKQQLETRGFDVAVEPSPWVLGHTEQQLQAALMAGWCEAALEQRPAERARIEQWHADRLRDADRGLLTITVAHHDLFGWPVHA